jgi:hypothetical protein
LLCSALRVGRLFSAFSPLAIAWKWLIAANVPFFTPAGYTLAEMVGSRNIVSDLGNLR